LTLEPEIWNPKSEIRLFDIRDTFQEWQAGYGIMSREVEGRKAESRKWKAGFLQKEEWLIFAFFFLTGIFHPATYHHETYLHPTLRAADVVWCGVIE
jgi:hypothetical protein